VRRAELLTAVVVNLLTNDLRHTPIGLDASIEVTVDGG
jgi:signal transduction histidine kinase